MQAIHYCYDEMENGTLLHIQDNGQGFDIAQSQSGLGLDNMREHAHIIGALFSFVNEPGQGTKITLIWNETTVTTKQHTCSFNQ
ncbi:MAG: hypothetical protein ABI690_01565 [Chloroflexota bacterium]